MRLPFLALLLGSALALPTDDVPRGPSLQNVVYTGPGCPADYAYLSLTTSDAGTGRWSIYSTIEKGYFIAYTGPGTIPSDRSRVCNLSMSVAVAPGWAVRVNQQGAYFRGWMLLQDRYQIGALKATYSFSGVNDPASSMSTVSVRGPLFDGAFSRYANVTTPAALSGCGGGNLTIEYRNSLTSLRADGGDFGITPNDGEDTWWIQTSLEVVKC